MQAHAGTWQSGFHPHNLKPNLLGLDWCNFSSHLCKGAIAGPDYALTPLEILASADQEQQGLQAVQSP